MKTEHGYAGNKRMDYTGCNTISNLLIQHRHQIPLCTTRTDVDLVYVLCKFSSLKEILSRCLTKYHAMKTYLCLTKHHAMKTYGGVEV
jgi:hypothetical protein